jgi:hypothetical protein
MSNVKYMAGTALLVQIGNGGSPETFSHDCLINTERGIEFNAETNRETIPDCADQEASAWSVITVDGKSATITGAGMLHTSSVETWFNWYDSGAAKNIRTLLNGVSNANGGGYWEGAYKLTKFGITGDRNQKAACSVTIESDGVITWVDA